MEQTLAKNSEYEILTPFGWEDFNGVIKNKNANKKSFRFQFSDGGEITSTANHKFQSNSRKVSAKKLKIGDVIDSNPDATKKKIIKKTSVILGDTYEVYNTESHKVLVNMCASSQCDELAHVYPQRIQTAFWSSISPTLSTGGSAIITSTPNGDQGLFAELWRGAEMGIGDFKHLFVPWDAPPGRDEKFKQKMIAEQGEQKWKQEFECQFISSDALLISSLFLQNLTTEFKAYKLLKEVQKVKFWDDIKEGHSYIMGVDPSTGSGNDFSVITIFSFPDLVQVAEYRNNTMSTTELYKMIKNLLLFMESKKCEIHWSTENNGVGEGVLALYENDEQQPESLLVDDPNSKRRGMNTTAKNKTATCVNFKQLFESGTIQIRSPILLKELKSYARYRGSYAAQAGATDDCVSAALIVLRVLQELATYDDSAFEKLYSGSFGKITDAEWETGQTTQKDYNEDSDDELGVIVM